jgi:hypothetical protein
MPHPADEGAAADPSDIAPNGRIADAGSGTQIAANGGALVFDRGLR